MIIDALCFPSWPSPLPLWGVVVARPGRLRHAADGPAAGRTGPGRGVLVAQRRRRPPLQGHRFRATVFEQPFPEYPSGWRLRFNGMGGVTALDHSAALRVMDGQGQTWELPNRSEELVPKDGSPVPAGSAQFDLDALSPRPSEAIPLEVELVTTGGPVRFDLTPEQTLQLNELAAG